MSGKLFLDTNILVYAYDTHDLTKQRKAQALITEGIRTESAVLSSQVLGEFFTVVTRRIPNPLSATDVQEIIRALSILELVAIDLQLVNRAIDTHLKYRVSYWDSLIIAAAERAGCDTILSEDLSADQHYHEILVVSPFKD